MELRWRAVGRCTDVVEQPGHYWEGGIVTGYVLRIEWPKLGLSGGNVAMDGWGPVLANQTASWGRGEHLNRNVPDFGRKGTGYAQFWPLLFFVVFLHVCASGC